MTQHKNIKLIENKSLFKSYLKASNLYRDSEFSKDLNLTIIIIKNNLS